MKINGKEISKDKAKDVDLGNFGANSGNTSNFVNNNSTSLNRNKKANSASKMLHTSASAMGKVNSDKAKKMEDLYQTINDLSDKADANNRYSKPHSESAAKIVLIIFLPKTHQNATTFRKKRCVDE